MRTSRRSDFLSWVVRRVTLQSRCQEKGVSGAMHSAVAGDLAGVIDPIGFSQHPATATRDEFVQVLHPGAAGGDKGVIIVGARSCETYDRATVVDRQPPRAGATERAEVGHDAIAEAKG